MQVFNIYSKVCLYGPINSYHSFSCSDLILYLYNKDMLGIRMKKFYCEKNFFLMTWKLCELRQFCASFQHGDDCKGSSSFRVIALNSSDSLNRHILILCLHHKQLKISCF